MGYRQVGSEFPAFHISVNTLENGKCILRVLTDDDRAESLLDAMGIKRKFSVSQQMDVAEVTPAQAIELLQRYFGGNTKTQPKRQLTDAQRQARAENAAKATAARQQKQR